MSSLDLSFNNEFPFNKKNIIKKNQSMGSLSIDNVNFQQRKIRINSPNSLRAIKQLGYKISDLEYLPFKEYIMRNPTLIGKSKKSQQKIYSYIENLRNSRFKKVKDLRIKLKTQINIESSIKNNSCNNLRKVQPRKINYLMTNSMDATINSSLEKEKKILERIKNKNETELINKIQFELQRELMRKKNEDKIKQQKIKLKNYQLELNRKKKEEESKKQEREKEIKRKQEELELSQRLLNKKRYMEEMKRAKEEEKLQQQRKKELEFRQKEEEIHRLLFKKKLKEILDDKKLKIIEKAKVLEMKELNKRKQLELKNKEQEELNMKKSLEKQLHIQQALKNYETKREEIRRQYKIKEKLNEEKEKRLELIAKKEKEKKMENSKKKEEEIKTILEKNKAIKQQKINNFYEKQRIAEMRRELFEKNNELIKLEKLQEKEEKEQKIRDTLNKNKRIMTQRKNKIIKNIKMKEYNTQRVWKKKREMNEKIEDYHLSKQIEKKYKLKEIEQQKLYKLNDKKRQLYDRDKRIDNFLKQKYIINEQKRMFSDEINKQKQLYSEKIQNLFGKNYINKKALSQIKNIFSNSQQISNVIDKFDKLIQNEE